MEKIIKMNTFQLLNHALYLNIYSKGAEHGKKSIKSKGMGKRTFFYLSKLSLIEGPISVKKEMLKTEVKPRRIEEEEWVLEALIRLGGLKGMIKILEGSEDYNDEKKKLIELQRNLASFPKTVKRKKEITKSIYESDEFVEALIEKIKYKEKYRRFFSNLTLLKNLNGIYTSIKEHYPPRFETYGILYLNEIFKNSVKINQLGIILSALQHLAFYLNVNSVEALFNLPNYLERQQKIINEVQKCLNSQSSELFNYLIINANNNGLYLSSRNRILYLESLDSEIALPIGYVDYIPGLSTVINSKFLNNEDDSYYVKLLIKGIEESVGKEYSGEVEKMEAPAFTIIIKGEHYSVKIHEMKENTRILKEYADIIKETRNAMFN